MASTINASSTGSGGLISSGDASGVLQLQSNGTTALTATGANLVTTGSINALNTFGFENRIINGAMVIDQRNAGAAVTADGSFPVDRWKIVLGGGGTLSVQQSTTVPSGFINSVAFTVTTPDTALGVSDEYSFRQAIEGLNVADLGWGTASAQTITLSFKVRSSLTGTFGGVIRNSAANRVYVFSYTITTANTWEDKSITIAGDTSGTWLTTNGIGLQLIWSLGAGTGRLAAAGFWGTDTAVQGVTGQTQWISTNGATFYITGVQLEKGTQATSFDFRSIGTELGLCQRYYWQDGQQSVDAYAVIGVAATNRRVYPVQMRTTPTITQTGAIVVNTNTADTTFGTDGSTSNNIGTNFFIVASASGRTNLYRPVQASAEL